MFTVIITLATFRAMAGQDRDQTDFANFCGWVNRCKMPGNHLTWMLDAATVATSDSFPSPDHKASVAALVRDWVHINRLAL